MKRAVWVIEKNYGKGFEIPTFAYNLFATRENGLKELRNLRWKMPQSIQRKFRLVKYVPEGEK